VREGRFRADLYFRLNVVPIRVPPLRERSGDVPLLAEHFLRLERRSFPELRGISDPALKRLVEYDWPGNVRELGAALERAALLRRSGWIEDEDIPAHVRPRAGLAPRVELSQEGIDLPTAVADLERDLLRQALRATGGNKNRAAQLLGLKRTTLLQKLRSRGLRPD
jgi:DNA-binding NtrC family response regulator